MRYLFRNQDDLIECPPPKARLSEAVVGPGRLFPFI